MLVSNIISISDKFQIITHKH